MAVPLAAVRFNEILIPECLGRRLCFAVQFLERGSQGSAVSLRPRSCSLSSTNKLGMSVLLPSESKQLFSWVNTPLSLSLSLLPLSQPHTLPSGVFLENRRRVYTCVSRTDNSNCVNEVISKYLRASLRGRFTQRTYFCFYPSWCLAMWTFWSQSLEIRVPLQPHTTQRSRTCYCVAQTAERWHLTDSIRTCLSRTNVPVTLEDHPQNLTNNSHWDYFQLRK